MSEEVSVNRVRLRRHRVTKDAPSVLRQSDLGGNGRARNIAYVRGTREEHRKLKSMAARELMSIAAFVRWKVGLDVYE